MTWKEYLAHDSYPFCQGVVLMINWPWCGAAAVSGGPRGVIVIIQKHPLECECGQRREMGENRTSGAGGVWRVDRGEQWVRWEVGVGGQNPGS